MCTQGRYCPEGTTEPVACPRGTFSDEEGLMNVTECEPCLAGRLADSRRFESLSESDNLALLY